MLLLRIVLNQVIQLFETLVLVEWIAENCNEAFVCSARLSCLSIARLLRVGQQKGLSEQSAGSVLSFPVVLIVLHIGSAYQEVVLGE